ncbi:MAG: hypothetical protein E4G91_06835, partial [Candidatus Zixiibacteriota bacterium]
MSYWKLSLLTLNDIMMKLKTIILLVLAGLSLTPLASAQNDTKTNFWSQQSLFEASGTITQLTIFPQVDTVGVKTVYRIEFGLNGDTLQPEASVQFFFPTGFGLTVIDSVLYSDDDPGNIEYQIGGVSREGQELKVKFTADGQAPVMGSKITLKLFGVYNATAARSYQIALAIVSMTNELIAAPTWSASFSLRADKLATFSLYPKGIQQVRAGTILQYYVETLDRFGNAISVQPINWSVIGAPSPTGTIAGGTFQAKRTGGSKIVASYQSFADTSSLVYVLSGVFAHFVMSGAPDTAVAGDSWLTGIDNVVVTAYDLFENVCSEYNGAVYFRASDTLAVIPYTKTAPYSFVTADQGRHTFSGSSFRFFTAGRQSLQLLKGDTVMQTISGITVLPAAAESYHMSAPDTVMAGHAFVLSVSDAADHWNNAVSGRVDLQLASGSGIAPSGALPSLSSFFATNGSGSGSVLLVRAGTDTLKVDLAGVVTNHPIVVIADSLARFEFALDAVQVPGRSFTGRAELKAFDQYANTCDWFNAALDPVTISCSGTGSVLNRRVDTPGAFVEGVCDLKKIGTGYSGTDLYVTFIATSQTGKKGTSPSIGFSYLKITDGSLSETTKYIGEQYTFRLTISDFGDQPGIIDAIRLYIGNTTAVLPSVDRVFPDTIVPLSNRTFTFRGDVPNRPGESVGFAAAFSGRIGNIAVSDSVGNLGTLTILPLEGVGVVGSSLSPLQVSRGKAYSFSVSVFNNSNDDLRLTTTTKLLLSTVAEYPLENPVVVLAHGGVTELRFVKADIPLQSPDLVTDVSVQLDGTLGSVAFDQSFGVTPPVVTQSEPSLSYQPASLSPTTMFRGRDVTLALDVMNAGTATLSTGSASVSLSVFAAGRQVSATVDDGQLLFPNGVTNLAFKPVFIPADFPTALDSFVVMISGAANGYDEAFKIRIPGSSVTVPTGAAVQLISTHLLARNAPHVN